MNALLGRSAIAMLLVGGSSLMAQSSTGALSGVVRDEKGSPIAGAQVTLTSPSLFQPKTIITDANGEYRDPLLPVGDYVVHVDKAGFQGATSGRVRVGLGSALRQDLSLKPAQEQSLTVVIVDNAATVDKTDTKDSVNVSAQTLQDLPSTDRNFGGAADLAPGVVNTGGISSIRGGTSLTTLYNINGANVKDDYQGGLTGNYLIDDNVEDVQVILSPLNARYGRTVSGQINVVTKTGGNDFEGSMRAVFDRNSWGANNGATGPLQRELSDNLNRNYQVTLRGPVWKDHIWFSLGTILTPSSTATYALNTFGAASVYNDPFETGNANIDNRAKTGAPAGYSFTTFQSGQTYVQSVDSKYFEGKLTWGITPNHTVSLAYSRSHDSISGRDPYGDSGGPIITAASLGTQTDEQTATTLNYTGTLTSSMFLEAKYSKVTNHAVFPTGDPDHPELVLMRIHDINSNAAYAFGTGISPKPDKRDNQNATVNLKLFRDWAGQMEFDFGGEYYEADRGTSLQTGPNNRLFRAGGAFVDAAGDYVFPTINWSGPGVLHQSGSGLTGLAPVMQQFYGADGTTKNKTTSLYANDSWTVNDHWNFMFGVRFDTMKVLDTDGTERASATDFSPRFQARYDLNGDSKHLFTFTAARLGQDFTTGFTDAFIKKSNSTEVRSGWSTNTNAPGSGADYGVQFVTYAQLTDPSNYGTHFNILSSSATQVASNLNAPYMDEFTLGYRRSYDNGGSFGITYVNRTWKHDWAFEQEWQPDYVATATAAGLTRNILATHVFNSDKLTRDYNGLEIQWQQPLNHIWSWGGNFGYSRLVGNNQGGDSGGGFRDNSPEGYYSFRNFLTSQGFTDNDIAPTGPLVNNESQRARVYTTAKLPLGKGFIAYSLLYRYDSGGVWSTTSTAPMSLPPMSGVVAPISFTEYYNGRGQYTFNDTYRFDFKVSYAVPIGISRVQLFGDLQVNNIFNKAIQATYDTTTLPAWQIYGLPPQYFTQGTFGTSGANDSSRGNSFTGGRSVQFSIGLKF
ncbi:MAG: TonB-dependent receptor [Acidobacteria bacterium]|nr:TonB-dependent receptor [Acidobacteriota bacterium]